MHLIIICIDSLRQDHVSFYAGAQSPVQTRHIDALAREAVVFENMYPEALPTIPIRTQLMTGQRTLGVRPWQPLHPSDRTIAQILGPVGYTSALITDTYHYFKPDYNFHRAFEVWRWIRGQEYDPYRSQPLTRYTLDDHVKAGFPPQWSALVRRCLQNVEPFQSADDHYCAQLVREALEWLEDNRSHERIFLWVDSFDPHEPWTPPREFDRYTAPGYQGKRIILPPGGEARAVMTPEEIAYTRGLYGGEVAYVDHYIGQLLARVRELELWDRSLIVLLSDHGHPLADHGKFLKGADRLYNELLRVPFMIRFPAAEYGGRRVRALAQFHDVLPTLLDALGICYDREAFHGHSLLPLIRGEGPSLRESIITGYYGAHDRCIRTETWSLILRPDDEPDELYHLTDDPKEAHNLIDEHPDVAQELTRRFGTFYTRGRQPAVKGVQGRYEVAGTGL
jgi:arylsulfatase A-like enzyme